MTQQCYVLTNSGFALDKILRESTVDENHICSTLTGGWNIGNQKESLGALQTRAIRAGTSTLNSRFAVRCVHMLSCKSWSMGWNNAILLSGSSGPWHPHLKPPNSLSLHDQTWLGTTVLAFVCDDGHPQWKEPQRQLPVSEECLFKTLHSKLVGIVPAEQAWGPEFGSQPLPKQLHMATRPITPSVAGRDWRLWGP